MDRCPAHSKTMARATSIHMLAFEIATARGRKTNDQEQPACSLPEQPQDSQAKSPEAVPVKFNCQLDQLLFF